MRRFEYDVEHDYWVDTAAWPGSWRTFREVRAVKENTLLKLDKTYPVGQIKQKPGEEPTFLIGTIYEDGSLPTAGFTSRFLVPVFLPPESDADMWASVGKAYADGFDKQFQMEAARQAALGQTLSPDQLHEEAQKLLAVNGKSTNPKEAIGSTKIPFHMIPAGPKAMMAMAFYEGGTKYGPYNWRVAGVRASTYKAAVERHLEKWWNGDDTDPTTHVHHLANAMAGLAIILDAEIQDKLTDDRPPKQDLEALFAKLADVQAHLTELNKGANPPNYTEAEHGKKEQA